MRPCVHLLASDQRYDAIVTPGRPGPNLPNWPVMASRSNVTGRDPGPRVSAALRYEATACRRPGRNPPKWPVMASGSDGTPGRAGRPGGRGHHGQAAAMQHAGDTGGRKSHGLAGGGSLAPG